MNGGLSKGLLIAEAVEKLGQSPAMTGLAQQLNQYQALAESFLAERAAIRINLARPTSKNSFSTPSATSGHDNVNLSSAWSAPKSRPTASWRNTVKWSRALKTLPETRAALTGSKIPKPELPRRSLECLTAKGRRARHSPTELILAQRRTAKRRLAKLLSAKLLAAERLWARHGPAELIAA